MNESDGAGAKSPGLLRMTADIVSAYVGHNSVPSNQIADLVRAVHSSLNELSNGGVPAPDAPPKPAVPVKRSVHDDYIVCLEDGKKLKMLKRYLRSTYGMSPDEYRTKWGLPPDYPMVAPKYAEQRSAIARRTGLGRRPRAD
jgi:predicted transcriptional regulator